MIALWTLCAANALLLWAPGLATLPRRVVRVVGVYTLVAFTIRGSILYVLQPAPSPYSTFPITTLAEAGYQDALSAVLPFAAIAAVAFYLAVLASTRLLGGGFPDLEFERFPWVAIYVLGAAAQVAGDFATALARVGSLGSALCAIGMAGVILCTNWRADLRSRFVLGFGASQVLLSALAASKTPLLTFLLLLYLDPRRRRVSVWNGVLAGVVVVGSFTAIQQLKPNDNPTQGSNILEQVFFSLSGRLDGLYALAGAWRLGPGRYVPPGGFIPQLVSGFLPNYLVLGDKQLAGALWGQYVYGVSSGVSYAEGLAGEGLAVGGAWGPLVWGTAGGVLVGVVIRCLSTSSTWTLFSALAFLGSTVIFERGLLGQAEQLGAAIQAGVVALVLALLLSRHTGPLRASATRQ